MQENILNTPTDAIYNDQKLKTFHVRLMTGNLEIKELFCKPMSFDMGMRLHNVVNDILQHTNCNMYSKTELRMFPYLYSNWTCDRVC